jgi:hypothetical protein
MSSGHAYQAWECSLCGAVLLRTVTVTHRQCLEPTSPCDACNGDNDWDMVEGDIALSGEERDE